MKKIAIDIDNTICNTTIYFSRLAEQYDKRVLHKKSHINYDKVVPRSDEWTKEELANYTLNVYNKEVINIPIKDDASLYINKLKNLGYKILIITNRGILENDYSDLIVNDYLDNNNIPYDEIITKSGDKYKYLKDCTYFIDDSVSNCEQALENTDCSVIMMRSNRTKDYENNKIFITEDWKEVYNYINNNEIVDNNIIGSIKTPQELLEYMSNNIKYGYLGKSKRVYHFEDVDFNNDWEEEYILENPDELMINYYGNCWDQVEFEREWFLKNNYEIKTIFEIVNLNYKNDYPTHSFLIYKDNNKWYWFENSDFNNRGIHEFETELDLLKYQYSKYLDFLKTFNIKDEEINDIVMTEFSKPKEHSSSKEYLEHVMNSKRINLE